MIKDSEVPGGDCVIYWVCGLPGSGKTTWVQKRMNPTDIVYDMDAVAGALTYKVQERSNPAARYIANEVYFTFVDSLPAIYKESDMDVYIIRTAPYYQTLYHFDRPVTVYILNTHFVDRGIDGDELCEMQMRLIELEEFCKGTGIDVYHIV